MSKGLLVSKWCTYHYIQSGRTRTTLMIMMQKVKTQENSLLTKSGYINIFTDISESFVVVPIEFWQHSQIENICSRGCQLIGVTCRN